MRDHRQLIAFNLVDDLVIEIYKVTSRFPREEVYGLTSQMRRSAVSVPSNIVEGCARGSDAEYMHFLDIAFGSLKELHYQFSLSVKLGFTEEDCSLDLEPKFDECEKVLASLIRKLRKNSKRTIGA